MGIGELRRVHRQSGEDLQLQLIAGKGVVHMGPGEALRGARGAADEHHRRAFGIGPGGGIEDAQTPHAIGHAGRANPLEPGIGVRRIARVEFVAVADQLDAAFHHPVHEIQHIIPGHAEHVLQARLLQSPQQVAANRHFIHRVLRVIRPASVSRIGVYGRRRRPVVTRSPATGLSHFTPRLPFNAITDTVREPESSCHRCCQIV